MYVLVMFGGAHVCLLAHVCVCGASMHTYMCLVVHECKQVVFHAVIYATRPAM